MVAVKARLEQHPVMEGGPPGDGRADEGISADVGVEAAAVAADDDGSVRIGGYRRVKQIDVCIGYGPGLDQGIIGGVNAISEGNETPLHHFSGRTGIGARRAEGDIIKAFDRLFLQVKVERAVGGRGEFVRSDHAGLGEREWQGRPAHVG